MKNYHRKRFAISMLSVIALSLLMLFYRGGTASTKVNNLLVAPSLSATKTAALDATAGGDLNGNGVVNPGDRIKYQVVINNSGTDAAGVNFSDQIDANTTYVAGSIIASPVAVNDSYQAVGNVNISVPAASGLLVNDLNPNGSGTLTITAPSTTTNGGNLSVNTTDGSFTYNPPVGFSGSDTFTYTLSNGTGLTDTGVVTINVTGVIWFINNNAAACTTIAAGCGRLTNPFSTLAAFNTANVGGGSNPDDNDNIFIYESATNYTGPVTLRSGQKLIGQDATQTLDTITGLTPPSYSAAFPAMNSGNATKTTITSAANGINLGAGNTIRGLTVSNTTGAGINGASIANATIGADVAVTGASGAAFDLSGSATGTISFGATVTNTSGRAISIQNRTGGTIDLTGAISDNGGTGVLVNSNTGATITFSGGLALSTGANAAFTASGGGTVNATQNNTSIVNTLTTTTGTALNVANTTIGASGLTFRSITSNANGATNGINLDTTGSGGLTVTGNGGTCTSAATCTGGTISNKTTGTDGSTTGGIGIYLNNASNVSLTNMQFNDFNNFGIFGNNVTNFTLSGVHMDGSNGNGAATTNEGTVRFTNLLGNALVQNSSISNTNAAGGAVVNFAVSNTGGTLTLLDFENTTLSNFNATGTGTDALFFGSPFGASGAVMNIKINNCTLSAARQFQFQLNVQGTTTSDVIITNNTFRNDHSNVVSAGGGSNLTGGGTDVYVHYLIQNNNFRISNGAGAAGPTNAGRCLTIGNASLNGTFNGKVLNNTFGVSGVARSGAGNAADALGIFASGNNGSQGNSKTLVQGNTIQNYGEVGILFNARQGSSGLDATVLGNIIRQPGPAAQGAFGAIWVNSGALAADTNKVSIAIGSTTAADKNTMQDSDPSNATDVFLDKNTCAGCASTLTLYRNGSAAGGAGEALIRQILVDDNNPSLDLLAGFTNGSTIIVSNGLPIQASRPQFEVGASKESNNSDSDLSILNSSYQSPSALLNGVQSSLLRATETETISNQLATVEMRGTTGTNYLSSVTAFFNNTQSSLSDFADNLASVITPTAYAQKNFKRESLAPSSGETVTKSLGTLPAGESVTVQFTATVNSTPATVFSVSNTAQHITAAGGIDIASNTVTTTVVQPPSISKTFGASFVSLNGTTTLTYTITNPNPGTALTGLAFSDTLPAGLVINTPNGLNNTCGGTVTATQNTSLISLTGGSINQNTTCTVKIDVKGTTEGAKTSATNAVNSTNGGAGNSASGSITVINSPTLAKTFTPNRIPINSTSTLQFTAANPNTTLALNNLAFSDSLPSGVSATDVGATTVCTDGSYSISANVISFTKPTLAVGANCVFSVIVTGTSAGAKNNITSAITATNSNAGAAASATLTVVLPPTITAASITRTQAGSANSQIATVNDNEDAENTLAITVNGVSSATVNGVTVSGISVDASGNVTANVSANCTATNASFTLRVTDSDSLFAETALNITVNPATLVWNGATTSDWNTATNWTPNCVPTGSSTATLPSSGVTNEPTITTPATVNNLTVGANRSINISGANGSLGINGVLTMSGNNINGASASNLLVVGSAGSITRTSGSVIGGSVRKFFSSGAGAFTFPVGTANGYSPVQLSNISGTGDFTVSATQGAYPNPATGLPVNRLARWWTLTNNGLTQADVQFNYLAGDITAGMEASYKAFKIESGAASQQPTTINTINHTATVLNVTNFSDWTLAEALAPTAAGVMVSGRVTNASGRGISGARITMIDGGGNVFMARTNPFGYYRFADVPAGSTYIITASAKRYQFATSPQVLFIAEERNDINFVALP